LRLATRAANGGDTCYQSREAAIPQNNRPKHQYMLNISDNPLSPKHFENYSAIQYCSRYTSRSMARWLIGFLLIFLLAMFLPWTQNVRAKGKLTTLSPDHRPQSIYSTISGRIERWYIREGQLVKKGDTIAFLSEVKADYFDSKLLERTQQQVDAKKSSIGSYEGKASALGDQIRALNQARELKISQTRNKIDQYRLKINSDSMDLEAIKLDNKIAEDQYIRTDTLYQKGIKSLTDLEEKRRKRQETQAKKISYENKLASTRADLLNALIDLNGIVADYTDKISKAESDRFSTLSAQFDAEGSVAKLESQYSSYDARAKFYYVLAPQDCYISKVLKKGLGEVVKENEELVAIMPADFGDIAVEMYIRPMDYPLIELNQRVRFIFDGWPAFVFSGWEGQSFGTFAGRISAVDNMASENGLYRILVSPDSTDKEWPTALRVGSAAEGIIMLNDVPLWYELWRQLNGFPPDFYEDAKLDEQLKLKPAANQLKK